jgi:endonuclease/exonuclease/phosphatase family metal-dependent hydrolase
MKVRVCSFVLSLFALSAVSAGAQEVVLHSTDVTTIKGNWTRVSDSSAASSQSMSSADNGWSSTSQPQASPADYFEASFTAQAWVKYRVWIRARAKNDSKWNESIWVQFGDSLDASGDSAYRVGTADGLLFNLESCSGCGVSAWGWTGGAYWTSENSQVQFSSAGTKTIRVQTREDGIQIDQVVLSASKYLGSRPGAEKNDSTRLSRTGGSTSAPTTTTARSLPGTVEAEDFESGSNGAAYYDRTSGNNGGQYRSTDVDIERTQDSSGSYNVGWIDSGEWLDYPVNVSAAGTYTLEIRVASQSGSRVHVEFDGVNETGTLTIPASGGWQSWTTVRKDVSLSAGTQTMRVEFESSGANFNYIKVVPKSTTTTTTGSGPFGGTAWAIPGTVQAEDFDLGANGTGYADNSSGNSGGKYRSTDVDIESGGEGYNVGWVGAGEWLKYTVNVKTAGTYTLTARVASSGSGGSFYVEFDGSNKTGTMTVPNTGGWQSYRDVNATVSLAAGVQTMRIRFVSNGSNGAIGNINYVRLASGTTTTPAPTGSRLRVMTWNIHFGKTAGNVLNLDAQAKVMADSGADVILLQEASTWDGDQPNAFPEKLRSRTGKTWYAYWAAARSDGIGQGLLILSKYPIASSTKLLYEGTVFSQIGVTVNGVRVNITNLHLEYYDTSKRTRQLNKFMEWARAFGGPRISGGDFNSWWGESWIRTMENEYSDTWQDVTGSDENGYTHNSVRFDYLFRAYSSASRAVPSACWVISTSTSDHRPVVADYTIK